MAGGINKLSAVAVQKIKEPGYYGDGGGLWLQLSKLGGKSWAFRFTIHGKRREMGLGAGHTVTLAEARERALQLRKQVRDGVDPIEHRKAHKDQAAALAARSGKTFKDCAEVVIATKQQALKNAKASAQWRSTLETYVYPEIGSRIVGTLTKHDVAAVLEPIWRTKHETASRLRGRIEAVFDYAKAMDYREGDNPALWKGTLEPILGEFKPKAAHHAALPYADVGKFMAELRKREGTAARAVELTILSAVRSGEMRGAVWDEFDLKMKHWTIPAARMKAGKEHRVPLSDDAVKLLKALPQVEGCPLVFPGLKGQPLSDMSLTAVLRRMNCGEVTVHGFRSTFRDWAGEQTAHSREVIEHALAHQLKDKAEAAYQRGDLLKKRAVLMADWARYCDTRPADEGANVVPINRKRAHK